MTNTSSQTVAISGATGLVGTQLSDVLRAAGHTVFPISRGEKASEQAILWDPSQGIADASRLESVDAVVHLAGENIAGGRWNAAVKDGIRNTRVQGTRSLVQSIGSIEKRPRTLICASAIGYYGERGDEVLTESASAGKGYLADVCEAWEQEAMAAQELGLRVVCVRIGVVLSPKGGALAKMLLPFKMGVTYWRSCRRVVENPCVSRSRQCVSAG